MDIDENSIRNKRPKKEGKEKMKLNYEDKDFDFRLIGVRLLLWLGIFLGIAVLTVILTGCGETEVVEHSVGTNGLAGPTGTSCLVTSIAGGAMVKCGSNQVFVPNGLPGLDGAAGSDGAQGEQGLPGVQGDPGQDGSDGADAPVNSMSIVSLVDPCGDTVGIQDEIGLRLASGAIIFLFTDNVNGDNSRLSALTPGSYMTTDGSNCHFSLDGSGVLTDQNGGIFNP